MNLMTNMLLFVIYNGCYVKSNLAVSKFMYISYRPNVQIDQEVVWTSDLTSHVWQPALYRTF